MSYRGLILASDVQSVLSSASQADAERRIKQASRMLETLLGRTLGLKIYGSTNPDWVPAEGGVRLSLSSWPIRSVDKVTMDGAELTDWARFPSFDEAGYLYRESGWPPKRSLVASKVLDVTVDCPVPNVKVEYAGGWVLPAEATILVPEPGSVLTLVSDNAGDTGGFTVRGKTSEEETINESGSLSGTTPVLTTAAPAELWEIELEPHSGNVTISAGAATVVVMSSSQLLASYPDVPEDLQELILDASVSSLARPVRATVSESTPGGGKVQWRNDSDARSVLERAQLVLSRYRRGWIA